MLHHHEYTLSLPARSILEVKSNGGRGNGLSSPAAVVEMSYDPKDDVDRLFACFKCGVSTPESALKEKKQQLKKTGRSSFEPGTSSGKVGDESTEQQKLASSTSTVMKITSGKQISPVIFYGSPHGAPVKRPTQLLRLLREIRLELREEKDLFSRREVWATFPKQEEAFRFAKSHTYVNVFSYQDHWNGQRRFLASTYEEFWRRYISMDPKIRHHYEVIKEGSPCHLYFDLEFDKKVNTGRNVDEMVDILISFIFSGLHDKYSIQGKEEWIVELDSSTEVKFSRHLVIRIPKIAFKDNLHAGAFVTEVCKSIADSHGKVPRLEKLYVKKDPDDPEQLFMDTAVYSRNRCFRLVFSSKSGKSSFLLPTGRFKCKDLNQQQVFMDSLICRMDMDCEKLLTCKVDLDCQKTLCFDTEVHKGNHSVFLDVTSCHQDNDLRNTYCLGKSPFPALDVFIESIASNGNTPGKIRSWYWFSAYGLIVYNMLRNRYCERIGREHKSNHVMYIVDFWRAGYYQKCYDPDCKGYRSPLRPLPLDIVPDNVEICSSMHIGKCKDVSITFDVQHDEDARNCSPEVNGYATDSCKKDRSWWEEVVRYADGIENIRVAHDFSELDGDIAEECEWWLDAEKVISQLEKQNN